jgi:HAD superfamily hydrolase (TIGR01509 family)
MFTVLWDNDGVLVETEGLYYESSRQVLATVGIELSVEVFQEVSLRQGRSTLELAAARGVTEQEIERLKQERDRLFAEALKVGSPLIPGAKQALESLHGHVRQGIVTSSRRLHFEIVHASTGLLPLLDFVLTREDFREAKPHPEPFLTAVQRFGLQPARCVVVEDSQRGMAAAVAAGLECLVVLSPWTKDGDFRQAAQVFDDIRHVPAEILRRASA